MKIEIDDSFYSRQRYVYGDEAMARMSSGSVLLVGLGTVGIEIAKNLVLSGVKSLTLMDSEICAENSNQFFIRKQDCGKGITRAMASEFKLKDLNPYVLVKVTSQEFPVTKEFITNFQVVLITERFDVLTDLNELCRSNGVTFITADVFGLCCRVFSDFGNEFTVTDINGEEPSSFYISNISNSKPKIYGNVCEGVEVNAVVTSISNVRHNLEVGDCVTFTGVSGTMSELADDKYLVTDVTSPYQFTINKNTCDLDLNTNGAMCRQIRLKVKISHHSLAEQVLKPSLNTYDTRKSSETTIHCSMSTVDHFHSVNKRFPSTQNDIDEIKESVLFKKLNEDNEIELELFDLLVGGSRGKLLPLAAIVGGMAAQETLKSLSAKYTPLNQYFYMECSELAPLSSIGDGQPPGCALSICLGNSLVQKLKQQKIFMVGCGAIGCELLKNLALLGAGTASPGRITVTDFDIIEKSNLNRQFLFRNSDINELKSEIAAKMIKNINQDVNIVAHVNKVCPETEMSIYNDKFYSEQNIVINALDNVEARKYVDKRCVINEILLLDSGTLGTKAHCQVILPHCTETYSQQNDPQEVLVPYCTLKSFPSNIQHCIQWAKDKFDSSYTAKPSLYNNFFVECHESFGEDSEYIAENFITENLPENHVHISRITANRCSSWQQCVKLARYKFHKYFNHKARHLLEAFPLGTQLVDGSLFWNSPKRPPSEIEFDEHDVLHLSFINSAASLYAHINCLNINHEEEDSIALILKEFKVPDFIANKKAISTDESSTKVVRVFDKKYDTISVDILKEHFLIKESKLMSSITFEKDDDKNHHIEFINAAANIRACMYSVEGCDTLKTKLIAGRIVPAIATTTSIIAGLVTVEFIKVVKGCIIEQFRNSFLNIALPMFLFVEPCAVIHNKTSSNELYTIWDKWQVTGNKQFKVIDFINDIQEVHNIKISMIIHESRPIYIAALITHRNRLQKSMISLLKAKTQRYFDLYISDTKNESGDSSSTLPIVRYYL